MTELNVGALFATVELTTVSFDRGYARVVKSLSQLDAEFASTARSSATLDDSLGTVGKAASETAVAVDRTTKANVSAGRSAKDAAVGFIALTDATNREKTAQLSLIVATEKLDRVMADGTATTEQYARAQASVISAEERVASAQRAAAASTAKSAAVQKDAAAESKGLTASLAGTVKMAGELGLVFGAFEAVKKAIDITKEASAYQRSMVQIRNLTGTTKAQADALSAALLNMAGKVAQSPEDLATSAYHAESALRKLGATAPQIYKTVETAAKGATIGNTDLEDTTNALTATMASGIVPFNQAGKAMGALLSIVGAGDMKVSDLNAALSTGLLVTMKTFGVSLTDTGAALAVFGDNNIRGEDAATKLRMAVQDLAKPAANADAVLGKIGLTTDQLRSSLEKNGLNGALTLLKSKLDAAGISGKQIGPFLEDAFTKRAGAGLAVLLTRMGQFNEAEAQIRKGAGSFGQQWSNVTKTASYALSSLGHEAEAEGIRVAQGLTPYVTKAANAIGVLLPAAVDIVVGAAKPFVFAFKAVGSVLGPLLGLLVPLVKDLHPIAPELKFVASAALALWAAFKGYEIATAALDAIRIRVRGTIAQTLDWSSATLGANERVILSNRAVALSWEQIAVANGTALPSTVARVEAANAAIVESNETVIASNRAVAGSSTGSAAGAGRFAGAGGPIAIGAASAYAGYSSQQGQSNWRKAVGFVGGAPIWASQKVGNLITSHMSEIVAGTGSVAQATSALSKVQVATSETTRTYDAATGKLLLTQRGAALSAKQMDTALQDLAQTQLAAAQSQDGFREGILSLTKTLQSNHDQLNQNTSAGLANRDALLGMLGQAVSLAQAQRKNGDSIGYVTGHLISNIAQLKQTAVSAGVSRSAVNKLITAMGLTPKDIQTKFGTNASVVRTQLNGVLDIMRTIGKGVDATVNVTTVRGHNAHTVVAHASGGTIRGPGTGTSDSVLMWGSNGEEVINAKQSAKHRPLLKAINAGVDGFSTGGTVGALAAAKAFARAQNSKPYQMGDAGPGQWDCSGLVSGVIDKYLGRPQGRLFSTANEGSVLPGLGFKRGAGGGNAAMVVGWEHDSRLQHTTGMVGGLKFEAYGDQGVPLSQQIRVGGNARDPRTFPNVMHLPGGAAGPTGDGSGAAGAGVSKVAGGWSYGGSTTTYASKRAAENAYRSHAATTAKARATAGRTAAGDFRKLSAGIGANYHLRDGRLTGGVESTADVASGLTGMDSALAAAGIPSRFMVGLRRDNAGILDAARTRNHAAAVLKNANAAVLAAQKVKAGDVASFRSAVTGGFDITSAGQDSNGRVTAGSLEASQQQYLTRTRAFVTGIDKLADMKIFPPAYLRSLAGQGVAALPTIQALLHMPKGKLSVLAANERTIARLGQSAAARVAGRLDDGQIRDAQQVEKAAAARERMAQQHLAYEFGELGNRIERIMAHLHMTMDWKTGDLKRAYDTDTKKSAHRGPTSR